MPCELYLSIGDVFVEDEAKNVVLVLVGFDFRPNLVGRLPDFRGELLLVHCALFLSWQIVSCWNSFQLIIVSLHLVSPQLSSLGRYH